VVIGAAMIVYTTRGGVSAVIWTDVVQMFIYVAGAFVIFFALLQQVDGGWSTIVSTASAAGKFRIFDFTPDPTRVYTFWSAMFGGVALTLATHGTDQYLVQRLLSARGARGAAGGLILSGVIVFAQFALFLVIGAMLFVFYQQTPLPRPLVTNDEVLPLFVVNSLSHGAAGFIVAAIIAAALSPSINAMAATTVNDFYLKYVRPDADQDTLMRVSKNATIFWGVAQIAVALGAQWIRSVLDSGLAVLSLSAGPVLGAFLAGVLTTRIGSRAMIAGMAAGVAVMLTVWWTAATAWTWYAFIGSSVTFLVALAASYVLPRTDGA
jgi:SSS family solute:Na+ symporter